MRKGKPHIPPGAPGHPRTGAGGQKKPRSVPREGPRPERAEAEVRRSVPSRSAPNDARPRARLVYEDEEILAYDKPVGLPVIAAVGSRSRSLLDIATDRVKQRNPKGRAAVVHRIDRDTSGIVVFATNARTKKTLMDGWDEFVTERLYVALVVGSMPTRTGSLDSWLKESKIGRVERARGNERGAKRAVTRWRVLGESPGSSLGKSPSLSPGDGSGLSLLELSLETGRKHQIRVQLADSGHPVLGDPRYGSRDASVPARSARYPSKAGEARRNAASPDLGRLCLHAAAIEIRMPGREPLRIESPAPPEFAAALSRSRK